MHAVYGMWRGHLPCMLRVRYAEHGTACCVLREGEREGGPGGEGRERKGRREGEREPEQLPLPLLQCCLSLSLCLRPVSAAK